MPSWDDDVKRELPSLMEVVERARNAFDVWLAGREQEVQLALDLSPREDESK